MPDNPAPPTLDRGSTVLTIGRRIRHFRTAAGMTLDVLADACGTAASQLSLIEKAAEALVGAAGHTGGPLTHRTVERIVDRLGFTLHHAADLPRSARSVTDLEHRRIYVPPQSIPGGHGLRSITLQAVAHRVLEH